MKVIKMNRHQIKEKSLSEAMNILDNFKVFHGIDYQIIR